MQLSPLFYGNYKKVIFFFSIFQQWRRKSKYSCTESIYIDCLNFYASNDRPSNYKKYGIKAGIKGKHRDWIQMYQNTGYCCKWLVLNSLIYFFFIFHFYYKGHWINTQQNSWYLVACSARVYEIFRFDVDLNGTPRWINTKLSNILHNWTTNYKLAFLSFWIFKSDLQFEIVC